LIRKFVTIGLKLFFMRAFHLILSEENPDTLK